MTSRARRSWANLPLRTKSLVVLGLPVLALLIVGLSALMLQRADAESQQLVRYTLEVRTATEQLSTAVLNAEAAVRGFLLTRDDAFLEPYHAARSRIPVLRARLDTLVAEPTVRSQLPRLHELIEQRADQWGDLATAAAAGRDVDARLRLGKATMAELRRVLDAMTAAEDRLLAARSAAHEQLHAASRALLVTALVLGTLGGGVATLLLTRGIVRRAQDLEADAHRLAAGEPLAPRPDDSRDELARVDAAMRHASQLLVERERALRQLNQELEAFSYSVSHDLRAPLRSIDGFSQALLEDYHDQLDATGQHYLHRSRAAAQRMALLIDDILMLSRVTRAELRPARVDLSAIARDVAAALEEHEPGRAVDWRFEPGLIAAGDPQLLRIALDNLLSNAWKFTARRERPLIEFGRADTNGTYVVRDNGAGFDMTYADKLFGAFQRLHATTEFPGTGIGLATVQRIVTKHGGRIWAEGHPGEGAAFYFTLGSLERHT